MCIKHSMVKVASPSDNAVATDDGQKSGTASEERVQR